MSRTAAVFALFALVGPAVASAQIFGYERPGDFLIVQDGEVRGEIHVEVQEDTCHYVEHWFLYERYVYPSEDGGGFTVKAEGTLYPTFDRFLAANLEAHPKGTWIEVTSDEHRDGCR